MEALVLDLTKLTLDGRLQVALLNLAPGRMLSGFQVVAANSPTLLFCFYVLESDLRTLSTGVQPTWPSLSSPLSAERRHGGCARVPVSAPDS